jgi:hypothetical protein
MLEPAQGPSFTPTNRLSNLRLVAAVGLEAPDIEPAPSVRSEDFEARACRVSQKLVLHQRTLDAARGCPPAQLPAEPPVLRKLRPAKADLNVTILVLPHRAELL